MFRKFFLLGKIAYHVIFQMCPGQVGRTPGIINRHELLILAVLRYDTASIPYTMRFFISDMLYHDINCYCLYLIDFQLPHIESARQCS